MPLKNGNAPASRAQGAGADLGRGQRRDSNTDRKLRTVLGLLPLIALETKIALDVARDLYLTGGCEFEDGKRLATAYKRLRRANAVVTDAEREVCHG